MTRTGDAAVRDTTTATTLLTTDSDARRLALVLHRLRTAAYRIAADCERMLESLHDPGGGRKNWRAAVGEALIASRHVLALTAVSRESLLASHASQWIAAIGESVQEPRRRIIEAMAGLIRLVPVSAEEELLLHDAREVRQTALERLAVEREPAPPASDKPSAAENGAQPEAVPRRPRVLAVDDEPALRGLLQRRLNDLGYDVVVAENGREALDVMTRESVDLVLTDINMPEIDGMELLRTLKGAERTRDIPVIVISSQDDLASVAACIELGAEDHIAKPYEPMLLNARLRASLERKRMRDLELDHLRRVAQLTAAAEAVEQETYAPGSLQGLAGRSDELGRLARVFDRMVSGLRSREERLQHRVRQLRHELADTTVKTATAASVNGQSPFASGEILAARYEILGQLGNGGMGMVYHARDLELKEEVAVKVVRRDLVKGEPSIVDRLKSEIRLARKISHRNVVRAHDIGEWNGVYFITMEYVKGITVAELLDRRGRLTVESTLAIATQLAEALATAHELQIVHRDVKPSNLLVDEEGVLKVTDFGIARSVEKDAVGITGSGLMIGSPQYMAPEQLMGGVADERSDLFCVGLVLYECLAGRPPFAGDSPLQLVAQIVDGNVTPLGKLVPGIPARLETLVHQQLSLHPGDRVGSARELTHQLAEIEHGAP